MIGDRLKLSLFKFFFWLCLFDGVLYIPLFLNTWFFAWISGKFARKWTLDGNSEGKSFLPLDVPPSQGGEGRVDLSDDSLL